MIPEDYVLTDAQLAILAAYEDDGGECWYRHPEFKALLAEGCAEFDLMRALALELRATRAALKVACEAIERLGGNHHPDLPYGRDDVAESALASIESALAGGGK